MHGSLAKSYGDSVIVCRRTCYKHPTSRFPVLLQKCLNFMTPSRLEISLHPRRIHNIWICGFLDTLLSSPVYTSILGTPGGSDSADPFKSSRISSASPYHVQRLACKGSKLEGVQNDKSARLEIRSPLCTCTRGDQGWMLVNPTCLRLYRRSLIAFLIQRSILFLRHVLQIRRLIIISNS